MAAFSPGRRGFLLSSAAAATVALAPAAGAESAAARASQGTVGVISGGLGGTYVQIATDLSAVLDDEALRVMPIVGKGSAQNIHDILYTRGVDIGIVQSDVLAYARRERLFPDLERQIQYIAKLYDEEVHILARSDIRRVEDLTGQQVNMDVRGSGTAMTASLIFDALQVDIQPAYDPQADALKKLRAGEIAAMVYVAGKPAKLFAEVGPGSGLHFLSLPRHPDLLQTYVPAGMRHADYPQLIAEGDTVDTMAVSAVMAVFAWGKSTPQRAKVSRFVEAFIGHFESFQRPPRHPKWREVDLQASVPGWSRFPGSLPAPRLSGGGTGPARTEGVGAPPAGVPSERAPARTAIRA